MNWMNLPEEYATQNSRFVILPLEFEGNVTAGRGSLLGSRQIIRASYQLEYYDEQFDCEPFEDGIRLLPALDLNKFNQNEAVEKIKEKVIETLNKNNGSDNDNRKFLISLGGDHSVTIGIAKGLEKTYDDFSVVILDAHSDFRHSWNGSDKNHACVAKKLSLQHKIAIIGARSMDVDDYQEIKQNENVHLLKSYDYSPVELKAILNQLDGKVYVSIDVDVFNPELIRNTGTPEPGGFSWDTVIEILSTISECKNVIGTDITEFSPVGNEKDIENESYFLAKLAYKIMAVSKKE